jgi:hypothetical protein
VISGTITQVVAEFSDGNYSAGELVFEETGGEGHGGRACVSEKVTLALHAHVLGRPDVPVPGLEDPAILIHSTPQKLREVCEDVLRQLDMAER